MICFTKNVLGKRFRSLRFYLLIPVIIVLCLIFVRFVAGHLSPGDSVNTEPLSSSKTPLGWLHYIHDQGQFSIHFPHVPQVHVTSYESSDGPSILVNEYRAEQGATFSVSYLQIPSKWHLFTPGTLLKGAIRVVEKHTPNGDIVDKRMTHHGVYPAMDFTMKEKERTIEGRLILVGHTIYRLTVAYPPETPEALEHKAFVNSFQVTPSESKE